VRFRLRRSYAYVLYCQSSACHDIMYGGKSICASVVYEAVVSEAAWVGSIVYYCGPKSRSSGTDLACERWGWKFVGVGYASGRLYHPFETGLHVRPVARPSEDYEVACSGRESGHTVGFSFVCTAVLWRRAWARAAGRAFSFVVSGGAGRECLEFFDSESFACHIHYVCPLY
jgi:hypothetical protein